MGKDINACPLACMNDGYNDLIIQRGNSGRVALAKILIDQDTGDYFTDRGDFKPSLHMEYSKCKTWRIDPLVKAPKPLQDPLMMTGSNIALQNS